MLTHRRISNILKDEDPVTAEAARQLYRFIKDSYRQFKQGCWGQMVDEDLALNEQALKDGGRIFASYHMPLELVEQLQGLDPDYYDVVDEKVWIITEADRSRTRILFPSDY